MIIFVDLSGDFFLTELDDTGIWQGTESPARIPLNSALEVL